MLQLKENQKQFLDEFFPPRLKFLLKRVQLYWGSLGEVRRWELAGCPPPPPHKIKQSIIRDYRTRYSASVLVETGTFVGNMIQAQKGNFKQIYSIELDRELHRAAEKRFSEHPNIHLIQGDSAEKLKEVVAQLKDVAVFWLDGHYSGGFTARGKKDCPILDELRAIYGSPLRHVILIDDARCFDGTSDYPTISELKIFVDSLGAPCAFTVEHDIIRIVPH